MRGFLFQRLTARVFTADPDQWLLKGGQALLVRYPGGARLSKDIDLQRLTGTTQEALDALLSAAAVDLGDHMRFVPQAMQLQGNDGDGINQTFVVYIGLQKVDTIRVDLVTNKNVTARPEDFRLMPRPDVPWPNDWPRVRLYPVVDHLADKICAMYEWHNGTIASSRFRDLADILLMSQNEVIAAADAQHALRTEAAYRMAGAATAQLRLPSQFEMPDRTWRAGYGKAAKEVAGLTGCSTWDDAAAAAHTFITPLLGGDISGTWYPDKTEWARD
ncbi:nucleotidyl transferase AbiEii/AbiGii toxin family protein [Streptomyces goshikiensis]|uniref:nucleotidyl transferase AbiEii/AbiGii toxin family protein n=1 Tax=Streptomyces goshikiensis TaxID=1942 RepID=UPI0036B225F2